MLAGNKRKRVLSSDRNKRRRIVEIVPPTIIPSARRAYYFPDGSCVGGVVRLFHHTCGPQCNIRFYADSISMVRGNKTRTVLLVAEFWNEQVMLKGVRNKEEDFLFGLDLHHFSQNITRSLTKNDSFLLYFEENTTKMTTEQINNKTGGKGQNRATLTSQKLFETDYHTETIGDVNLPNYVVEVDDFCHQCTLLFMTKCCQTFVITCNPKEMRISGHYASSDDMKELVFPARNTIDPVLVQTYQISSKTLKTLTFLRNVALPKSEIKIYFAKDTPVLFSCTMSEEYGRLKIFIRDTS